MSDTPGSGLRDERAAEPKQPSPLELKLEGIIRNQTEMIKNQTAIMAALAKLSEVVVALKGDVQRVLQVLKAGKF